MKRFTLFALPFIFISSLFAAAPAKTIEPESLEARIQAVLKKQFPAARFGMAIRSSRTDSLQHQIAAQDWFTPASTLKMVVTASAIDTIPLDWRPQTKLSLDGIIQGKTFLGQLRVIGGGDPNISSRYFDNALTIPRAMADSLRALGIDTVHGLLVADTSAFQGPRRPHGWRTHFFNAWYGAEISALSFNDNAFLLKVFPGDKKGSKARVETDPDVGYIEVINQTITQTGKACNISHTMDPEKNRIVLSGSIGKDAVGTSLVLPVRNPAAYFLTALRHAFKDRGIVFVQDQGTMPSPARTQISFTTAPFQSMLDEINQRSQNLHAELLLRDLGQFRFHDGSTEGGLLAEKFFLQKMKLPVQDFYLIDGCGLSPENKIKPASMSLLLARMTRHPYGKAFASSMGIPGITGNSAKRLTAVEDADQVRYKTGFIGGVQGLVGYIGASAGDTMAVALYLNGYKGSDDAARNFMDTVWNWIAREYNGEYAAEREARSLWYEADTIQGRIKRIDYFSHRLLGRPYLLGPTGEGALGKVDPKPLMNLAQFDCVTYIEHVLALAAAKNPDSIFSTLQQIRYVSGHIAFENRKHYFVEDWIGKSPEWVRLTRMPGDTMIERIMDKKKFFAAKGIHYPSANPTTKIPYLSIDKAIALSKKWDGPDTLMGIGFMSTSPSICVFHTGILIAKHGASLRFRNASLISKQTAEQDLGEYLQSKKAKIPGIVFFDFLDSTAKF